MVELVSYKLAVESVTSAGSRRSKITIGYRSQVRFRPRDTLPVLGRAQGVSAELLASPLLTPRNRSRSSTSTRRGGRRVSKRGLWGYGEARELGARICATRRSGDCSGMACAPRSAGAARGPSYDGCVMGRCGRGCRFLLGRLTDSAPGESRSCQG